MTCEIGPYTGLFCAAFSRVRARTLQTSPKWTLGYPFTQIQRGASDQESTLVTHMLGLCGTWASDEGAAQLFKEKKICLLNSRQPAAILTTGTVMCHFEVHNNEQSHSITVLDVPLCLLNQLSQLLFALCLF